MDEFILILKKLTRFFFNIIGPPKRPDGIRLKNLNRVSDDKICPVFREMRKGIGRKMFGCDIQRKCVEMV